MNDDLLRWKDAADAPADYGELLRETSAIGPMPTDVREAILAALPAPAPSPATAPAAATGKAIAAAAIAGAVVIAGVVALRWPSSRPSSPSEPPVASSSPTSVAASASIALPPPIETPAASASAPPSAIPSAPPARIGPTAPRVEGNLAEESLIVGRARQEMASSPAAALAALDEHARRFPRGELATEREYLRLRALRALGRDAEARSRAESFLRRYPTSPYAASVRALLEEMGKR